MNKEIKCIGKAKNCEGSFVFTEGEQKYFLEKGLEEPKRCKPCRVEHKEWKERQKNDQSQHEEDLLKGL